MKIEEIAIGYAIQTNNLRINKKRIKELECIKSKNSICDDVYINLGRFRDSCIEDFKGDYYSYNWCGWEVCLNDSGIEYTEREMSIAKLLDQKRLFIQARAEFKRALYREGNKLIKDQ